MKIFNIIFTILAVGLIVYNATKLNFDALLQGESFTAVLTILVALCALILVQVLRISKKIEKLQKKK